MRILVTGADGMVGSAIKEVFSDYDLILTDKPQLDVRSLEQVKSCFKKEIDLIIHLAAETDLEFCQDNPAQAYYTNHTGTLNIAHLAHNLHIPLVYIGTAGIFDSTGFGYNENSTPNPLNHYGQSKLYGEYAVIWLSKFYIFRASWMMGGGQSKDKKFVNKIFKQIQNGAKEIYALSDVYGSPTYTVDLALTIHKALEKNIPYGVYHCGGLGSVSRYDVAVEIVKILGLETKVIPVTGDYFKDKGFPCPRSECEVLDNSKLLISGVSCMRFWKDTLKEYLTKEFKLDKHSHSDL